MSLNKAKGEMYDWVTHTHNHLGGECPHKCHYCYVNSFRQRVPKYQGELRLIEKELRVNYGSGKTIFVEDCNDLFAEEVPMYYIKQIIEHCYKFKDNNYIFQTKNPARYLQIKKCVFPENSLFGTTIETNRDIPSISNAPQPYERTAAMEELTERKFVTIEPILDFNIHIFTNWIKNINPEFVNIGADSKRHNLLEPSMEKVQALIDKLRGYGIEVREKRNLERLRKQ